MARTATLTNTTVHQVIDSGDFLDVVEVYTSTDDRMRGYRGPTVEFRVEDEDEARAMLAGLTERGEVSADTLTEVSRIGRGAELRVAGTIDSTDGLT